jgi:hypothetical protein
MNGERMSTTGTSFRRLQSPCEGETNIRTRAIFSLAACCALAAARLPAEAVVPGFAAEILMHNDAFGPGPVSEWDDLRTFGFDVHSPLAASLDVDASYDSLTWRGAAAAEATRLDTLKVLLTARLPRISLAGAYAEATFAGGLELAGNLGGRLMQQGLHGNIGISRPVPQTYDSFSSLAPAAAASAEIGWESGTWRLAALAAVEGEAGIGTSAGAGLRLSAGAEKSGLTMILRSQVETTQGVSPTLDRVSANDSGVIVGTECAAGRLRTSLQYNLSRGVSEGAYGVQLGRGPGLAEGLPLALEIGSRLNTVSPGQRVFLPAAGPHLRLYASQASGWWNVLNGGATCERFSDYGAGVEGRILAALGKLELEAGMAVGPYITAVTEQSALVQRSSALSTAWMAGLRVKPVLRIGVLEGGGEMRVLKTGAGLGCSLDAALTPGSASQAHWVTVEIFIFSETR